LNCPNYINIEKKNIFREKFDIKKDQIIFLYQGDLGVGRNITNLIKSFSRLKSKDKVIVFMGDGPFLNQVKNASKKSDYIFYHEAVDPDILLNYTSSADIGMSLIENTSKSYNYCMPNKMFEYMMAGIPIIVTDLYEMSNFIKNNNIGYILKGYSVEEIINLVDSIDKYMLSAFFNNINDTKRKYNWGEQEKILLEVYRDLYN